MLPTTNTEAVALRAIKETNEDQHQICFTVQEL